MKRFAAMACLLGGSVLGAGAEPRTDVVVADFEGQDYGAWTVEGAAFGAGPARGTLAGQMKVDGFVGHGLVNSYHGGDRATGRLISPEFRIERKHLVFLIGGGGWPDRTCLNLRVGTNIVRTAAGPNTEPGGSEELEPAGWDVGALQGRTVRLEIVDSETGGWGHINVDQIVQSDRPAPVLAKPTTRGRDILLDRDYLLLPVQNGSKKDKKQLVSVSIDGRVVRAFDIDLAEKPDWFAHLDVRAWQGKKAALKIERLPADSTAPGLIVTSDTVWHPEAIYREPLRGQLHFSSRRGWNNDPNGMVFADGEYHLYYQHNPYGWPWGNMHWGHAVSPDLVHWRELPIALYPPRHGDWAFSGSAVVDRENTSGWKRGTNELIVAAFTSTARGECMVHSTDGGRTFTEFEGNPVVRHKGRDPRLLWHAPTKQWVMAVYDEENGGQWIAFHTSPDLKTWTYRSRIEGFYECPDLFELPIDGARRWVLTGASSEYMVGDFDGQTFKPITPKLKGHLGKGFYAAQTFTHEPRGRVVQIGWFQTATPGMPFNQSMSLPNELRLAATPEGPRLTWTPVEELSSLRTASRALGPLTLQPDDANPFAASTSELVELRATFAPAPATVVVFGVRGVRIAFDPAKQELSVNGHRAPAPLRDGSLDLTIIADRIGLEIYAAGGRTYIPFALNLAPEQRSVVLEVEGGPATFSRLDLHELKSIWP